MFKREIKRIGALLILTAVVYCLHLYNIGRFDLSFIDREYTIGSSESEMPENPEQSADSEPEEAKTTAPVTEMPDNLSGVVNSDAVIQPAETGGETPKNPDQSGSQNQTAVPEVKKPEYADAASLRDKGYVITNLPYDKNSHVLAETKSPFRLKTTLYERTKSILTEVRTWPVEDGEYVVEYVPDRVRQLILEPYMGYIFYDYDGTTYLMDSTGKAIDKIDLSVYTPAYTRDRNNNPLFYTDETNDTEFTDEEYGDFLLKQRKFYYYSLEERAMVESDYIDEVDGRGVYMDYPAYYGQSDGLTPYNRYVKLSTVNTLMLDGSRVSTLETLFAYGRNSANLRTSYRFSRAFNYTEHYAVAELAENGLMTIVAESGYSTINSTRTYVNSLRRYVISDYLLPAEKGISSLGFYYFDHGLVRMREQIYDNWNFVEKDLKKIVSDEDYLVNYKGQRFDLPHGYDIIAYSNGVILLCGEDGKYGYMDYTGKWIAQPIYTYAQPFVEGLAAVGFKGGRIGMIDTEGNVVLPLIYDHVSDVSSGVITAYKRSWGWTILNKMVQG